MRTVRFMRVPLRWLLVLAFACTAGACRGVPDSLNDADAPARAEALAARMLAAINYDAWLNSTAAVSWSFQGTHRHLWDRKRGLVRVEWDDRRVLLRTADLSGRAFARDKGGAWVPVTEGERELLDEANAKFINDAYWLNPLFHIRSPGAQLSLVDEGTLKVYFSGGGVTPGDTYLLRAHPEAYSAAGEKWLVREMQFWVRVLPVRGAKASLENYVTTTTGVRMPTHYDFLINVDITDLNMVPVYPPPGMPDEFALLVSSGH